MICNKAFTVFKLFSSNHWKFLISQKKKKSSKWQFVENNKKKNPRNKLVIDLTAEEAEIIPGTCRENDEYVRSNKSCGYIYSKHQEQNILSKASVQKNHHEV